MPGGERQMFFIEDAWLTGFKMILDLAFDGEGNLCLLQHATGASPAEWAMRVPV